MIKKILYVCFLIFIMVILITQKTADVWKITKVKLNNKDVSIIEGFLGPYGITLYNNNIYVPDIKKGAIYKFSSTLKFEEWLGFSVKNSSTGWFKELSEIDRKDVKSLNGPHSIAFDKYNRTIIADYFAKNVKVYDSHGAYLFNINDYLTNTDAALVGPANVYIDRNDFIWISDWDGHKVVKLNLDFKLIGFLAKTDNTMNGFKLNGHARASNELGGLNKPHMVTVDKDNNIYIAETGNNRIQKFNSDGISLGWIGAIKGKNIVTNKFQTEEYSESSSLPGGFDGICSITLADNNYLVATDNKNNRIEFFDLEGKFIGWIGGSKDNVYNTLTKSKELSILGSDLGYFSSPFQAIYEKGYLYVADGHNRRIQIFDLN